MFETLATSYPKMKTSLETRSFVPGTHNSSLIRRVVNDYHKNKAFVIEASGNCSSFPLHDPMTGPCVPDDAIFVGTSTMGLNLSLRYNTWVIRYSGPSDGKVIFSFSDKECAPLVEEIKGIFNGIAVSTTIIFSSYEASLKNPTVFDVPAGC
ncbi:uncharacterized protein LOC121379833 [Gigantopelta aegis]|uniref:uncharacterized protein LOC121379833 n=1 Tax=Gigantopelta aegis TaxID=1735272 RepID=UPI001B88C161|nr:uncharacterized protein LOC121379833 [Gigantopelta aegis]